MHARRGVFKLFCPCTADGVLLAGFNVLPHRPLKLFKLPGGKQLVRLGIGYPAVVCGKALIPCAYLRIYIGYSGIEQPVKLLYTVIGPILEGVLHDLKAARPVVSVVHSGDPAAVLSNAAR